MASADANSTDVNSGDCWGYTPAEHLLLHLRYRFKRSDLLHGLSDWTSVGSGYLGPAELFEWVKGTEMKPRGGRLVQPTMIAAVILGLLSLGCFLTGAIKVVLAFHVLGVS